MAPVPRGRAAGRILHTTTGGLVGWARGAAAVASSGAATRQAPVRLGATDSSLRLCVCASATRARIVFRLARSTCRAPASPPRAAEVERLSHGQDGATTATDRPYGGRVLLPRCRRTPLPVALRTQGVVDYGRRTHPHREPHASGALRRVRLTFAQDTLILSAVCLHVHL